MRQDLLTEGAVKLDERTERAQAAVRVFRTLQPTLTSYARALTGNKNVRVDIAARDNGSTDGSRIYFRPPIELGDRTPHNRHLCNKRGEDKIQLCPACRVRESILVTIYHEIAHICFDSFAQTENKDIIEAIAFAVREAKGKWSEQIAKRIEDAPRWRKDSYIALAGLINNFLPIIVNALEDARVNRELFKARAGTKKMFDADTEQIFRDGYECADGIKHWNEAPLNMQAIVGVFTKASGYDYSTWFHPKVVDALNDETLTVIVKEMDEIRSAGAVYGLSFKVLARLRELGFCGTPEDPAEPEPEPEGESDEQEEQSDSDKVSPDPSEESDSTDDSGSDSGEGESSDDASDSTTEGESSGSGDGSDPNDSSGNEGSDSENIEESDRDSDGSGSGSVRSDSGESDSERRADPSSSDEDESSQDDGSASGDDFSKESVDGSDTDGVPEESSGSGESEQPGESDSDHGDQDTGGSEGERVSSDDASDSTSKGEADGSRDGSEDDMAEESEYDDSESDAEPVDTGADDGYGGTQVLGEDDADSSTPDFGTPDEVKTALLKWGDHEEKPKSIEAKAETAAVDKAVVQGIYFTKPSTRIYGVREHYYGKPIIEKGVNYSQAWRRRTSNKARRQTGQSGEIFVEEQILQPALQKMRRVFSDNKRGKNMPNKKSGHVNARVLGKRAWNDDVRLFHKKVLPGKKDYFVVLGMDLSGSTVGRNILLEKRAIAAQAELLSRVGIPFVIYGHTGNYHDSYETSLGLDLEVYHIKDVNESWNDETKSRLEDTGPSSANLDGHALEFLRKKADESRATDKIILYYSDGKMPAENHDEELAILTAEIETCRRKGYTLLGVGIRTDSPARHGLDTVEVNEDADLVKVVQHLAKRLSVTI